MGLLPNVCILGWDCVPDGGRVKIYLADPNVTKANVHHLWTLGGRLNSSTIKKGWELLSRLWDHLGIPEGVRSTTELGQPEQEDGRSGLTFSYELRPGSLEPEPKIYIPLVGENDMAVVRGLAQFTSDLGWTDLDSYPSKLANVLYVYSLLTSELTRY
jgi:DMATS type aromatic prenyltransferase